HIDKGEFYVDKKTKSPVLLKIFDDEGKERILISYKEFKSSKESDESLFYLTMIILQFMSICQKFIYSIQF
ncbi:hypothetical protein Q604_UNBC16336G0001, partial [human gut metagenome]